MLKLDIYSGFVRAMYFTICIFMMKKNNSKPDYSRPSADMTTWVGIGLKDAFNSLFGL